MFGIVAFSASAGAAWAQASSVGYAFGSPGFSTSCCGSLATLHAGGGEEVRIGDTFGIGSDIGYLAPFRSFTNGVGLWSVNGTYYLPRAGRDRRVQPFVTGGYSLAFRNGTANLWNAGGGADYWATKRVGLRVEIRDHILPQFGESTHFWGPRVGIVIRGQ